MKTTVDRLKWEAVDRLRHFCFHWLDDWM